MRRGGLSTLAALACVAVGCGGKTVAPVETITSDDIVFADDAVAVFADLERRLTEAAKVAGVARVHSLGFITSDLDGELHVEPERTSWLKVEGAFAGMPSKVTWTSEAPVGKMAQDVQPVQWANGLLLGMTRMGVLHNWAKVI